MIPRAVDDYWQFRERLVEQALDKQLGNPAWHLLRANGGFEGSEAPGAGDSLPVTYGLLLNLASVLGAEATEENLRDYLESYIGAGKITPELAVLIGTAVAYTRDYIVPTLEKRAPTDNEAEALRALDAYLADAAEDTGRRGSADPGLRNRQARGTWFRHPARLVQGALPDVARQRSGAAHGQLHCALWRRQYAQADRRGVGARPILIPGSASRQNRGGRRQIEGGTMNRGGNSEAEGETPEAIDSLSAEHHASIAGRLADLRIGSAQLFLETTEQTRMALALSDPHQPDCPIVYCNKAFTDLTGYSMDEIIGQNCRFLQGRGTRPSAVAKLRKAIETENYTVVDILNYRKDGTAFWNAVHVGPIYDREGNLAYFFGSQWDIYRAAGGAGNHRRERARCSRVASPHGQSFCGSNGHCAAIGARFERC